MKTSRNISCFVETNKKVEFTYSGWDGTGYNGEGKKQNIWVIPGDGRQFVMRYMSCYKAYCFLEVTNEKHEVSGLPVAQFYSSVAKENVKC